MLIGRFVKTEWAGSRIFAEGNAYQVEDIAWLSAAEVVACEQAGDVVWASPQARLRAQVQAIVDSAVQSPADADEGGFFAVRRRGELPPLRPR